MLQRSDIGDDILDPVPIEFEFWHGWVRVVQPIAQARIRIGWICGDLCEGRGDVACAPVAVCQVTFLAPLARNAAPRFGVACYCGRRDTAQDED